MSSRPVASDLPAEIGRTLRLAGPLDPIAERALLRPAGRVGTAVHFDNPITPEQLARTWRAGSGATADQGQLVVRQTLRRIARQRRSGAVNHHTFVYGGSRSRRLGLPRRGDYVDHVQAVLRRHGIGKRPFAVWAYPTNTDLPLLIDALDPDLVVADVVDDNRTWFLPGTPEHDRADLNYEQVLHRSDLVIANCDPVAESMRRFVADVHVVPNGLVLPDGSPRGRRPEPIRDLAGPIIGYVGNLSSRIDIDLLDHLARARPAWQFAFIGPSSPRSSTRCAAPIGNRSSASSTRRSASSRTTRRTATSSTSTWPSSPTWTTR